MAEPARSKKASTSLGERPALRKIRHYTDDPFDSSQAADEHGASSAIGCDSDPDQKPRLREIRVRQ
jgi:hypothetical protein